MSLPLTAAGVGAVALLVLLTGVQRAHKPTRAVGKLAASSAFLAAAASLGLHRAGPAAQAIVAGLVLSFIGDVLLLWDDKRVFAAGLGSFLLAHVAYTMAFWVLGVSPVGVGFAGIALLLGAISVWTWLADRTGRLRQAVLAYVVVICLMSASAVGAAVHDRAQWLLALAAVLFFASDLFVARERFVLSEPRNRFAGLPLYYAAQALFVAGAPR